MTRDFDDLSSMNNSIVDRINKVASPTDEIYCLGDWAFGGVESYPEFREKINCRKVHLILGNHDGRHGHEFDPIMKVGKPVSSLFESYSYYSELILAKTTFCLFHYPIASWNRMGQRSIHLFGHCHSSPDNIFFNGGLSMDVGMDGGGPYTLDNIFEIMDSRSPKSEGHH